PCFPPGRGPGGEEPVQGRLGEQFTQREPQVVGHGRHVEHLVPDGGSGPRTPGGFGGEDPEREVERAESGPRRHVEPGHGGFPGVAPRASTVPPPAPGRGAARPRSPRCRGRAAPRRRARPGGSPTPHRARPAPPRPGPPRNPAAPRRPAPGPAPPPPPPHSGPRARPRRRRTAARTPTGPARGGYPGPIVL